MALMKCRECGGQVSDMAGSCPHCGCPVGPAQEEGGVAAELQPAPAEPAQEQGRDAAELQPAPAEPAQEQGGVATKTDVVLGCGCLILLLLFGLAAWGYFLSDTPVEAYIGHLWEHPKTIVKWGFRFLVIIPIVVIWCIADFEGFMKVIGVCIVFGIGWGIGTYLYAEWGLYFWLVLGVVVVLILALISGG